MSVEDFTARRRAAIEAQRLLIEEMKAEDERDYQIIRAEAEFEDWIERERVKRQKYEQAMAEKRARISAGTRRRVMDDEEDNTNDEAIWERMCVMAAKRCSLSIDQVKAIADEAGLHAYGHLGIFDLVEVVAHHTHNRGVLEWLRRTAE